MPTFQCCLVFLQVGIAMDAVVDEIFGVKLFSEFEAPTAEDFFKCASCDCLVLFRRGGGKNECMVRFDD